MPRSPFLSALVAVVLLVAAAPAQTKPFKISGSGQGTEGLPAPGEPARPHNVTGTATHLGRHTGSGTLQNDTANFDDLDNGVITGEFHGHFTFEKKNGDKLVCDYGNTDAGTSTPGQYRLVIVGMAESGAPIVRAYFIAEFVVSPTASTGKFAGVTGSWVMYAQTEPFVLGSSDSLDYSWEGEGELSFPQ